jgi:hypothetical protein
MQYVEILKNEINNALGIVEKCVQEMKLIRDNDFNGFYDDETTAQHRLVILANDTVKLSADIMLCASVLSNISSIKN